MIRFGKKEDLDQIDAFDKFGGDRECASEADREKEILEQRLQVYISENKVTGYISIIENSCLFDHPLITFLCVHHQYRRQGIASTLLSAIEQKYIDKKLFISTESNNPIMLSLIKKRGYILSGSLSGLNEDGSDEVYFYKT